MSYSVKEIFFSLQGEGLHAGRPAVFCRFSGCNFWSGREQDRANAICNFCDTDFVGRNGQYGGLYPSADKLVAQISHLWPKNQRHRYVILTGGEPLLQVDSALIDALHEADFAIGLETNGSLLAPDGIDWICVSPKASHPLKQQQGDELKVVIPQAQHDSAAWEAWEKMKFTYFFVQPMDGPQLTHNIQRALAHCLARPLWRLSLQMHKQLQIP